MVENIYKYAVENKLRFPFKGQITIEDVFDLDVEELDTVFKTLNKQVKVANEESLLTTKTAEDIQLDVKIQIIKEVFTQKQAEIEARKNAAINKAEKQKLMQILADKQDAALKDLSIEELQAKISAL